MQQVTFRRSGLTQVTLWLLRALRADPASQRQWEPHRGSWKALPARRAETFGVQAPLAKGEVSNGECAQLFQGTAPLPVRAVWGPQDCVNAKVT